MNDQGQCETCESLAHELAEVKRENEQLRAILSDKSLEAMETAAFKTSLAGEVAVEANSAKGVRYIKTQLAANDLIFAQHQALMELPLKLDQMKAKNANLTARTDLITTDKRLKTARTDLAATDNRLKEEKIKDLQAGRLLKESQARLLGAATMVLERYAQTGNMVDADFEVIDQLKQIGVKIPARITQKTSKKPETNKR